MIQDFCTMCYVMVSNISKYHVPLKPLGIVLHDSRLFLRYLRFAFTVFMLTVSETCILSTSLRSFPT